MYYQCNGIWCECITTKVETQTTKFMGPTWGPPGSCPPQMCPLLAPWTLLSGNLWKLISVPPSLSLSFTLYQAYDLNCPLESDFTVLFLALGNVHVQQNHANTMMNSSPPSAAYMCQSTRTAIVQVIACGPFGTKPLPEPMRTNFQLDP